MRTTKIEWTEKTWNPITGCTKYSAGCAHCYAATMTRRLMAMGLDKYMDGFEKVVVHEENLKEPFGWSPSNIFVCSMSDIFHKDVPFEFVDKIMDTIIKTPQHRYQILTKRAERMEEFFSTRKVPKNAWLGVTIENKNAKQRIRHLSNIDCGLHFLSCEPLLEDLGSLDLSNIQWVIVGGESGVSARPMKESWVLNIKKQVLGSKIPFFFKQWGTWGADGIKRNKHENGKQLEGRVIQQMPVYR